MCTYKSCGVEKVPSLHDSWFVIRAEAFAEDIPVVRQENEGVAIVAVDVVRVLALAPAYRTIGEALHVDATPRQGLLGRCVRLQGLEDSRDLPTREEACVLQVLYLADSDARRRTLVRTHVLSFFIVRPARRSVNVSFVAPLSVGLFAMDGIIKVLSGN